MPLEELGLGLGQRAVDVIGQELHALAAVELRGLTLHPVSPPFSLSARRAARARSLGARGPPRWHCRPAISVRPAAARPSAACPFAPTPTGPANLSTGTPEREVSHRRRP